MNKLMHISIFIYCFFVLGFVFGQSVASKQANEVYAQEEFRRGVQAYYRGAFNQSILQFEKAIGYMPEDNRILDWLGKSYYRSGMESTALKQWEYAYQKGYGGLLLQNRIEIVKDRRITGDSFDTKERYVEAGSFMGSDAETLFFSQPVSLLPEKDGSCWVLAYGSNELLRLDVNGTIIKRIRGPLNGFDRPFDLARSIDGQILLSEYAGDRITILDKNGIYVKSFGAKGTENGQFLGPQYIAVDASGKIYVTDFGNARVVVFNQQGEALFTFGTPSQYFTGLKAPTGIASVNGLVYVADAVKGCVYTFDTSGNFMDILVPDKTFFKPEAIKIWNNFLIIADSNQVFSIDVSTGAITDIASVGNSPASLTCAIGDYNENLIVSDIQANEVYVLAKMSEVVGGLFVQVERVISDSFPNVYVDIKVENRKRQPVVGLQSKNFLLTEKGQSVQEQKMIGAAYGNDTCDITIVIDRISSCKQYEDAVKTAVREIALSMKNKGTLSIVSSGSVPIEEMKGTPDSFNTFEPAMLKNPYASNCPVDLALRLAGNNLILAEPKRAIVYLSSGEISDNAFDKYSYSDTAAWLNNNNIAFLSVNLSQKRCPGQIAYLTRQTQGNEYYVYRPEGLTSIATDVCAFSSGVYRFSFISKLPTNFGRDFLPIETEVYMLNRSGRDETGYFAPLE